MARQGHEPVATEVKAYIRSFQNFDEHCTFQCNIIMHIYPHWPTQGILEHLMLISLANFPHLLQCLVERGKAFQANT